MYENESETPIAKTFTVIYKSVTMTILSIHIFNKRLKDSEMHDNLDSTNGSIRRSRDRYVTSNRYGPFETLKRRLEQIPAAKVPPAFNGCESIIYMRRKYGCNACSTRKTANHAERSGIALLSRTIEDQEGNSAGVGHREIGILKAGKYWR